MAVGIDLVPVGNPGNPSEWSASPMKPRGDVRRRQLLPTMIGKFEVTHRPVHRVPQCRGSNGYLRTLQREHGLDDERQIIRNGTMAIHVHRDVGLGPTGP